MRELDFWFGKYSHRQTHPFYLTCKKNIRSVWLARLCLFHVLVGGKTSSCLKTFSMLKSLNHLILLRIQQIKPHLEGEPHCHFPVKKININLPFYLATTIFSWHNRKKIWWRIPIRGANAIVHRVELEAVEKEPQLVHRSLRGLRRLGLFSDSWFSGKGGVVFFKHYGLKRKNGRGFWFVKKQVVWKDGG